MSQSRTRSPLHLVGLRAIGAVAAPVMVAPLLATGTAHAAPIVQYAVPGPPQPQVTLPAEVDVAPTYQAQTTCDPSPKPGAVAFARLLNAHYGTRVYGISRACGNGVTEHSEGRALDWMINANVPREKAIADSVVQWLSATDERGNVGAMARRFGINYIIWNRKIWRAYAPARGWANYTGPHPHHDHIHISFTWDGAYQRTSWWTGRALGTISVDNGRPGSAPPAVTPVMTNLGYLVLRLGSSNDDVRVLQRALNTSVDGLFGSGTERAVRDFQSRHRLMTDGIAGPQTWAKLIELGLAPSRTGATPTPTPTPTPPAATHPLKQFSTQTVRRGSRGAAVTALQRALGGVAVDGSFGPATERALLAYQESKQLNPDGVVNANVWNALMDLDYTKTAPAPAPTPSPTPTPEPTPAAHALEAHSAQTLRRGATGAAVTALQRALGGIDADGSFGPATERAVVAYQKSKDITGDGVVNANVWNALMGRDYTKTAAGSPAPTPEPAPSTHALEAHASQTLRRGASGAAVTALQRALGGIEVDGSFGPATERAVVAYQRSKGIAPNGIVDASVWNALMGRGGTQGGTAPTPPAPTPEPATPSAHALEAHASQTLRRGASGAAVTALQRALGGIEVDGSFGPATERAVLAYQRANALRGTGVVTADMWNALMGRDYPRVGDEAAAPAPKPTPPAADEPNELDQFAGQTLRRGSRGDAVVVLQTALGDVEVDGSFGPATEARVVAFQRSKDLTANGIVTGEVWTALMNR